MIEKYNNHLLFSTIGSFYFVRKNPSKLPGKKGYYNTEILNLLIIVELWAIIIINFCVLGFSWFKLYYVSVTFCYQLNYSIYLGMFLNIPK